jgi:hypothetical protein
VSNAIGKVVQERNEPQRQRDTQQHSAPARGEALIDRFPGQRQQPAGHDNPAVSAMPVIRCRMDSDIV